MLVVDDNPQYLELVSNVLAKEDLKILKAPTAESALESLSGFRPRIVLSDLVLPGMNGLSCST
jgi:DNA-binding response OmpR family regulator